MTAVALNDGTPGMRTRYNDGLPAALLRNLERAHQEIKKDYLAAFGKAGIGAQNNGRTRAWLEAQKASGRLRSALDMLREVGELVPSSSNLSKNYSLIRSVYAINPSFHENWFFDGHLTYNLRAICKSRLGLKAYLTSARNKTLSKSIQSICTSVLRHTILLENLTSARLKESLADNLYESSDDIQGDIGIVVRAASASTVGSELVVMNMPMVFRIVRQLLEMSEYKQLTTSRLLSSWLTYAPCGINCGPVFTSTTDQPLVDVLKGVPALDQVSIRKHLREHYVVQELMR